MNDFGMIDAPQFDYVNKSLPHMSVNPSKLYATWLNLTSGELFICLDATTGYNVWKGQFGTSTYPFSNAGINYSSATTALLIDSGSYELGLDGTAYNIVSTDQTSLFTGHVYPGTDGYVSIPNNAIFDSPSFTICFWYKAPVAAPPDIQGLFYKAAATGFDRGLSSITMGTDYSLTASISNGTDSLPTQTTSFTFTGGQWAHIAVSASYSDPNTEFILAINGDEEVFQTTLGFQVHTNTDAVELGRVSQASTAARHLTGGSIGGLKFLTEGLSAQDINTLYEYELGILSA